MTDITRRSALKLSGQAFLAVAAATPVAAIGALKKPTEAVSWERFLELCHHLSEVQFSENWNQQNYCRQVQQLLKKLRVDDPQVNAIIQRYRNFRHDFPEIRNMHYEQRFMVSMLEFEPGEEIGLHDHPDMTGVTFCTEGRLHVEHFDLLPQRADSGAALLRQQQKLVMGRGDSAILTVDRGNIHTLQAEKFTRLIDVFTPPYNRDRSRRSKYYRKADAPYQNREGVFEAETV